MENDWFGYHVLAVLSVSSSGSPYQAMMFIEFQKKALIYQGL